MSAFAPDFHKHGLICKHCQVRTPLMSAFQLLTLVSLLGLSCTLTMQVHNRLHLVHDPCSQVSLHALPFAGYSHGWQSTL